MHSDHTFSRVYNTEDTGPPKTASTSVTEATKQTVGNDIVSDNDRLPQNSFGSGQHPPSHHCECNSSVRVCMLHMDPSGF